MFTVKATYRGETRKFTFTDTYAFPSFFQLYNQVSNSRRLRKLVGGAYLVLTALPCLSPS